MIHISKNCKFSKLTNILNPQMGAAILFVERRPPIKSRSIWAAYRPFKNARDQIWICQI